MDALEQPQTVTVPIPTELPIEVLRRPVPDDNQPEFIPGRYRHYRGNFYDAICLVQDRTTEIWNVLYRPHWIPQGTMWIQPLARWNGPVAERGACILTDANMHTKDDCTQHRHETPTIHEHRFVLVKP